MFNATQNFVAISLRILHISDSWSISFLHITVQNIGGRGHLTDSAQFTANVTILSSDTRSGDTVEGWDSSSATGSSPHQISDALLQSSQSQLGCHAVKTLPSSTPPVISLKVGVNVNNCNKLHWVHASAACEMNINKNVNCCLLLL